MYALDSARPKQSFNVANNAIPEKILRNFRVHNVTYGAQVFTAPWSLWFPRQDEFCLYFLTGRKIYFECPEDFHEPVVCKPDTLIAVAGGQAHGWRSSLAVPFASRAKPGAITLSKSTPLGSNAGAGASILTRISVSRRFFANFLRARPVIIIEPDKRQFIAQMHDLLQLMNRELFAPKEDPAAPHILKRLTEILLVFVTQYWLDDSQHKSPDKVSHESAKLNPLNRVIHAIHERPDKNWTLAGMAKEAEMRRTSFFLQFKREMRIPPMEYLTNLRMSLAAVQMRDPDKGLAEIAWQVGYHSQAAFNRAFTRHYAMTPGRYRRLLNSA